MKHRIGFNRLGRKSSHRKAMTRNMVTSLFLHERVRTTKAKALAVRRTAEKMITRAKEDSVHNRRTIARDIKDKAVLAKLFTDIGPRFKERPGGYTRILKLGPRSSDAAEMVLLELVGEENEEKPKKKAEAKTKTDKKKAEKQEAKSEDKPKTKGKKADTVSIDQQKAEATDDSAETVSEQSDDGAKD